MKDVYEIMMDSMQRRSFIDESQVHCDKCPRIVNSDDEWDVVEEAVIDGELVQNAVLCQYCLIDLD